MKIKDKRGKLDYQGVSKELILYLTLRILNPSKLQRIGITVHITRTYLSHTLT